LAKSMHSSVWLLLLESAITILLLESGEALNPGPETSNALSQLLRYPAVVSGEAFCELLCLSVTAGVASGGTAGTLASDQLAGSSRLPALVLRCCCSIRMSCLQTVIQNT
jgi:hypothetical protein